MAVNNKRDRQLDAERGVIGSLLIEPDILRELLALVREEDFLNPVNRLIFQAARTLFRAGKPVDAMTLRGQVGEQYSNYLVQMVEITPTAANWREYARLMHEQAAVQRGRSLADKLSLAVTLEDLRPVAAQLGQLGHIGIEPVAGPHIAEGGGAGGPLGLLRALGLRAGLAGGQRGGGRAVHHLGMALAGIAVGPNRAVRLHI